MKKKIKITYTFITHVKYFLKVVLLGSPKTLCHNSTHSNSNIDNELSYTSEKSNTSSLNNINTHDINTSKNITIYNLKKKKNQKSIKKIKFKKNQIRLKVKTSNDSNEKERNKEVKALEKKGLKIKKKFKKLI